MHLSSMDCHKDTSSHPNLGSSGPSESSARKRHSPAHTTDNGNVSTKRRRRVFSCESCQRLKCRCDYDVNAKGCRRCQTLRIVCSNGDGQRCSDQAPSNENTQSIEDRLRANEEAVAELKTLLETISQEIRCIRNREDAYPTVQTSKATSLTPVVDGPSQGHVSDPADHAVHSAPIVVLREIAFRSVGGSRRIPNVVGTDINGMGLLDQITPEEFEHIFEQSPFLARETRHLALRNELQTKAPFLYNVCYLRTIPYRSTLVGTPLHEEIYERARRYLGEILLSNMSTSEDIQAILLMNEGLFNPSGIEYIDGWMLTGYAAQKAMLSISFSKIVTNIKNGEPTVEDTAAVRLWSHICLYHLHWAATTGRPSTIPTSYLKHCNIILNFYNGTLEDSIVLAEIALYEIVLQKMNERPSLHSEDEEFAEWKQKWNYLLSLPTSSFLKIGYSSACLILTTKWLEDLGEDLRSAAFLSNSPLGNDAPAPSRTRHADKTNTKAALLSLRARSLTHARSILETFLQMPHFLKNAIMTNRCLCLGYSALILAHYGELHSEPPDRHSLHLVSRLEDWLSKAPGKSAVIKFATMAKQRLMARLSSGPANDEALGLTTKETSTKENNESVSLHPASDGATAVNTGGNNVAGGDSVHFWPDGTSAGYEAHGDATFPNMEEFFSGGFLGFQFE